jgi:cardiolipin synthase
MLKYIPNTLTVIRLLLITPFLFCLFHKQFDYAFYVFVIAGLTDALDGHLARFFSWQSDFGRLIDPMADKLLISASFISLGLLHVLPWWLVILIFFRDCLICLGVMAWYLLIPKNPDFRPSNISKLNTILQLTLVMLCLYDEAFGLHHPKLLTIVMLCTAATTSISLIDYVWTWGNKAWQQRIPHP